MHNAGKKVDGGGRDRKNMEETLLRSFAKLF